MRIDYNIRMAKKKFYAVLKGRKPGIYTEWNGPNGAEAQVAGFAGAKYKGFATHPEADYYLKNGGAEMPDHLFDRLVPEESAAGALPEDWDAYKQDLAKGKLVIFTDGASTGNPGPGGYGVVMLFGEARKELTGGFRCTTNNRMEMMGVIAALQTLKRRSQVVLYSDSRYVVNAIEKGWAKRWKSRGWMRDAENPAENADLWAQLLDLLDQHEVEIRWVKGHASHPENERCDQLAVQSAHRPNLPADSGYKGSCR